MKGYIKVIRPFKRKSIAKRHGEDTKSRGVSKSYRVVKAKKGYFLYQKPKKKGYKY